MISIPYVHDSVTRAWHEYNRDLEGRVPHMYLDVLGYVTTGMGNLADPSTLALAMPWKIKVGGVERRAERVEILADFDALKTRPYLKRLHYKYAQPFLRCYLTDADIDELVERKLAANVAHLMQYHFPALGGWPADAQMATLSIAWACGAGFPATWPNFKRAMLAGDFAGAIVHCEINARLKDDDPSNDNPGVVPRNTRNKLCLSNAAFVVAHDMRRDVLHWPGPAAAVTETPTLPLPPPRPAVPPPPRSLRLESPRLTGPDVFALQRYLKSALGYGVRDLAVDGVFGPATDVMLRRWQRVAGLVADGVFGPLSRARAGI